MKRVRILGLLAMVVIGAAVAWWFATQRPLPVTVAAVERDVPITVFGLGTVEARVLSRIGFEVAGTLLEVAADHGDLVPPGGTLARLDTATQSARVARAQAAQRSAEAAVSRVQAQTERLTALLAQKQSTAQRRRELASRGAGSAEAAEAAETELATAIADMTVNQADLAVARAALAEAEANLLTERVTLEKHVLKAPFAARVVARLREPGSALTAGADIFTLVSPETIWALVHVDEGRAGALRIGQVAQLTLRSRPGERYRGEIVRIGLESDRVTEERRVYIVCRDCPQELFLGEQIEALIEVSRLTVAYLVPETATSGFDRGEATFWTLEDGRLAQRRMTVAARTSDGRLAVTEPPQNGGAFIISSAAQFAVGRPARAAP